MPEEWLLDVDDLIDDGDDRDPTWPEVFLVLWVALSQCLFSAAWAVLVGPVLAWQP